MKLKPIPNNTVIHTPTEAEAKELLAILHENGYKWNIGDALIDYTNWSGINCTYHIYPDENVVTYAHCVSHKSITLAEFKERYCEAEKPQPKFKVCDKVIDLQSGAIRIIQDKDYKNGQWSYLFNDEVIEWVIESALEPYTEPETKPTEDMEANKEINKELNLCELLNEHEGEEFYSIIAGKCRLKEINEGAGFPLCIILDACTTWEHLTKDGKRFNVSDARCILFSSRSLYEQYPLDPYTAWMKWQEVQTQYKVHLMLDAKPECAFSIEAASYELTFRTPADRDKCIEEIKAIIEKYSSR